MKLISLRKNLMLTSDLEEDTEVGLTSDPEDETAAHFGPGGRHWSPPRKKLIIAEDEIEDTSDLEEEIT
eukprot:gene11891-biopygen4149